MATTYDSVLVDTDVVIDYIAYRQPFVHHAVELFSLAEQKEIKACIATLSYSNCFYVLCKRFPAADVRRSLHQLYSITSTLDVTRNTVKKALASDFVDFEDALQYYTAIDGNVSAIVTRNIKDYKASELPVFSAESFINTI